LAHVLLLHRTEGEAAFLERRPAYIMVSLKHVLVASDFGEASDAALLYGLQLARAFGATLHVVHVIEDISGRLGDIPNPEAYIDYGRWRQEAVQAAEADLKARLSDEDRRQLGATATAVLARTVAPAILTYARDHQVDLIVAGTHGRGALAHLVMGSVAERLVRQAPCPVLVVRHPEREFVLPDALQVTARPA
jgi:nucleotide-binding universal stress UspA family protein